MTWLKLDDGFFDHPKVLAAGKDAALFYLAALCWCSQQATDGLLPPAALPVIAAKVGGAKPRKAVDALVVAGLFEIDGPSWRIHDYCEHQRSRSQRDADRDAARERQRKARESQRDKPATPPNVTASSRRSSVAEGEKRETDVLQGQPTSQWGANWRPSEASSEWAYAVGFSTAQIDRQTARFVACNTRRRTEFRDVEAAWRAWMRRELPNVIELPKARDAVLCGLCDAPLLPGLDGELECSAGCEAVIIDLASAS